jgi:ABC-type multidrug transport system ATPase subunit
MEVRIVNLKKYFGKTKAVDDISFGFSSGQIVGFVGPKIHAGLFADAQRYDR